MATLRDAFLPVVDALRGLPGQFGVRRYAVTLRRRIWSGTYAGDGTPTNQDLVIAPLPRVRNQFSSANLSPQSLQYILANGSVIDDRLYQITGITPQYTNADGTTGGYRAQDIRMRPSPDVRNVEPVVILVGDDGYLRECVQVLFEQDRPFGYSMLVKESDRPRVQLTGLTISPAAPSVSLSGIGKAQLTATGTFADGSTSDITPLVVWSSGSPAVATVNTLGLVQGLTIGTSLISASLSGVTASSVTLTVGA